MQLNWMKKQSVSRRLGVAALLLALASPAVAAEYRPTRPQPRPSVLASCAGIAPLQPAAAASDRASVATERRVQGNGPQARKGEGVRQHRRFYRTACPDADAMPLRLVTP